MFLNALTSSVMCSKLIPFIVSKAASYYIKKFNIRIITQRRKAVGRFTHWIVTLSIVVDTTLDVIVVKKLKKREMYRLEIILEEEERGRRNAALFVAVAEEEQRQIVPVNFQIYIEIL